jgi:hypothetical protein
MVEIVDFLNNVTTKNYVEAEKQFNDMVHGKLTTRIETEKQEVANAVFNNLASEEQSSDEAPEEIENVDLADEEEKGDEEL